MSSPKYLDKIINSSLQKIKKEFEYDNNSMIKDFKRHDSIENLRTQMSQKLYKQNLKWRQTLSTMKEIKKEDVQKKRKILLAKMSKHTELVQKLKEAVVINKTQSIMAKSQKFSQLVEEREENVEKAKRIQEEERLLLDEKIKQKLNHITTNYKNNLSNIKQKFHMRSSHSVDMMNQNFRKLDEMTKDNIKKSDEKGLSSFEKLYRFRLERDRFYKEKRKHHNERLSTLKDNIENIEKIKRNKSLKTINLFKNYEMLKMKAQEKNDKKIKSMSAKLNERLNKVKNKKDIITYQNDVKNDKIITKEMSLISNSSNRDYNYSLLKSTIAENFLIQNVEKERKINAFMTEIYSSQDKSLFKITDREKKNRYLEIKRQEDEKKKEEMEKYLKLMGK